MSDKPTIRLLVAGRFDPAYARNAVLLEGFASLGWTVTLIVIPAGTQSLLAAFRLVLLVTQQIARVDIVVVPSFNQIFVPIIGLVCALFRKPLAADYMVGLTDTALDRQPDGSQSLFLRKLVDRLNITAVDTITDTRAHRQEFERLLACDTRRMTVIPVGARSEFLEFSPVPSDKQKEIVVTYVGTYIPFHGVDIILRAAALLADQDNIRFELIGSGQTYSSMVSLSESLRLANVKFIRGWFELDQLLPLLSSASMMLGVFGDSDKTRYVIPNKVFEALAMGLPLITAESPALDEFLTPGQHLVTVPPGNPEALADAIVRLAESPSDRARLGAAGRQRVQEAFTPRQIGIELRRLFPG